MPPRPDDEPDFADALATLVDKYQNYWETPAQEILDALAAQIENTTATLGTESGGPSSVVSPTPDPPE